MQFPPQLYSCLFISHLKGKCRGLLKLNQTYLLMIPGLPLWGWGSQALWHPDSHVWRSLPSFGRILTTDVTSTGENTNCTGVAGEERGCREATEKVRWKNFRRQGGMKRGRDRQRMRPHFHCLMTDRLPSGLNHDLWLTGRGKERVGNEGAGRGLRMGAAQNILPYRGLRRRSLMIKNIPGKACFLCVPAMLFVGRD